MTANINFRPLYGCGVDEPYCSLLCIDKFTILLDCGWNDAFDETLLAPLKQVISQIDAVLISYPDLAHMGALPYAVAKLGLSAPIYCTLPVYRMGEMFLYEAYQTRQAYNFTAFNLDDIDLAFKDNDNLTRLKYSQDEKLRDKGEGIVITPEPAGHMVGGTIWKIKKETEDIIYAVDYNHKKERHLENSSLKSFDVRPTVLITDASTLSDDYIHKSMPRTDCDRKLIGMVKETMRNGGNVLMPVDAAGRLLELSLLLHTFWEMSKFGTGTYSLLILSTMGYYVIKEARTQIEWMSKKLNDATLTKGDNPFTFKNLTLCHDLKDLRMHKDKPFLCLATSHTMRSGFSQEVFRMLAGDPKNLVIFTQRAEAGTLAHKLMQTPTPRAVSFIRHEQVDLSKEEVAKYLQERKQQREQKQLEESNAVELLSDMDDDDDDDNDVTLTHFQPTHIFPMFAFLEEKRVTDVYGELINNEEYRGDKEVVKSAKMEDDIAALDDMEEIPKKNIDVRETLDVRCRVEFIDYEGRSDRESVIKILARLQPRKLIIIHGDKEAKQRLGEATKETSKQIRIPENGQNVDITSETNIRKVNLTDSLLQSLDFVQVGEYEIAYAEGQVEVDYQKAPNPLLKPAPEASLKGHDRAFLGNPTFHDLKKLLNQHNIKAEFYQDGVLVCCGGTVNLRKEASNTRISIHGALTEDYFRVREVLYGSYEIL